MAAHPAWKRRMEALSVHIQHIVTAIEEMDDEELRQTLIATEKPTTTNCGWDVYQAAPIVRNIAARELRRRHYQREAAS